MRLYFFMEFYLTILIIFAILRLAKKISKKLHSAISFFGCLFLILIYIAIETMDIGTSFSLITSTNEYRNYYYLFVLTLSSFLMISGVTLYKDR